MPAQPPSIIEREFAQRYDQEHARVCHEPQPRGLFRRLAFWRAERLVRNALKEAGEPGLVLDLACGAGRFWPVLAEHANRVILAADQSQEMLDHAQTHHSPNLLKRIKTFHSSAFTIGLTANAVDCIFCMRLYQYLENAEHRLALLREFQRVSRDTVIVSVRLDSRFKLGGAADWQAGEARPWLCKSQVEAEFREAGFKILMHQDLIPWCGSSRVYVLRKASQP